MSYLKFAWKLSLKLLLQYNKDNQMQLQNESLFLTPRRWSSIYFNYSVAKLLKMQKRQK